jgi:hypothetical protein
VGELLDMQDVTGAAVASLEATLARIERAEAISHTTGPADAPSRAEGGARARRPSAPPSSAPTSRRGSGSGGGSDEGIASGGGGDSAAGTPSSLALVSRELVRSQMAAADLQRKLRVCARCVRPGRF